MPALASVRYYSYGLGQVYMTVFFPAKTSMSAFRTPPKHEAVEKSR
ncbi:hypothetical protein BRO54_2383 [Geobacillus proteiniphilus]|uniref:Uncharacterized protein n=1 Tax=Geobacillus proteiniphilus TaxID=860353 RepID=A0A1Q5SX01_9BACL|nr:hypothetical protein BRO54_2383 [Geobacillus proteiniphilus]